MSLAQPECCSTGSTDRPMILTPRLSNSGLILAMYPSSVVQTGVKSLGCENSTHQELPIQSWNLIFPSVVWASKSGAVSLIASDMMNLRRAVTVRGECARYIGHCGFPIQAAPKIGTLCSVPLAPPERHVRLACRRENFCPGSPPALARDILRWEPGQPGTTRARAKCQAPSRQRW